MARIRTIKPEFWTSEQVADCSLITRLMFLGMLNFCDDNGIHPASSKRIKMEVFPSDAIGEAEVAAMIRELVSTGLVAEYKALGNEYWLVTGWHRHQKIEKPTYRHPLPNGTTGLLFSDTARRQFAEQSLKQSQIVIDHSTPEWNGMESNGENLPIQDGHLPPKVNVPMGDSTFIEGAAHA